MTSPVVLITCKQMQGEIPAHRDRIESQGFEIIAPDLGQRQQFSADELLEFRDRLVGIIAGDDELNERFFRGAPDLRTVIRWGVGMDSVDMAAAKARGISVRNTPGVFAHEVADSAFGYILNLARGYLQIDAKVRQGEWPKFAGVTLAGSRLGIVGYGAIGREIANRARGFSMDVVAFDPFVDPAGSKDPIVDLAEVLSTSRFIVLACPLTPETHHLINRESLGLVSSDSYLINVARGPVIDEGALLEALSGDGLAGAALDVFETEPLSLESQLRLFPNVILGAHNASNTHQGVQRASAVAVQYLLEELSR